MAAHLKKWLSLKRDCRAVTAVEYALIAGLIGLVMSAALLHVGTGMAAIFMKIATTLSNV